jgi:glycosyltransferase involved in cell wall biosynthesis
MNISIIIPFYNDFLTINNAVNSVHNNCGDYLYEIIIIDDGSNHILSLDFLSDNNFVKIYRQANSGVALARDFGIIKSTGTFIAFLDADDIWLDGKIKAQIEILNLYKNVNLVGTLTNGTPSFSSINNSYGGINFINVNMQIFKNYFQPSTVLIRRDAIVEINNHFHSFFKSGSEEGIFFNRLVSYNPGIVINRIYVDYSSGKRGFGISGLSKRIYRMELGEIENITRTFFEGRINIFYYFLAINYSLLKFIRRLIIFYCRL